MKKKNLKLIIIIAAIVVAGVIVTMLLFLYSPSQRVTKLLDLGDLYLESCEYEQAIAAYDEVLKIDPKCVEAYLGEADAYVAFGDYESAIAVLEKGYEETEDGQIKSKLIEIREESLSTVEQIDENDVGADEEIVEEGADETAPDENEENELYAGVVEAGNIIIWGKPFSEWTYDALIKYVEANGTQDPSMAIGWHYNFDGNHAYASDEGVIPYVGVTMDDLTYFQVNKDQRYGGQIQSSIENNYKSKATPILGMSLTEFLTKYGAEELQNEIEQISDGAIMTNGGEVGIVNTGGLLNISAGETTIHFYKNESGEWVISSIGWMELI